MHERWTLGRMQNPVRGFLHGGAAVAASVGLGWLAERTWGDPTRFVGVIVFGLSMIGVYTVSSLYHSVPWSERWKRRMQRLDHTMIFFLVAGTYTPLALGLLDGAWRIGTLAAVWSVAVTGAVLKLGFPRIWGGLSIVMQLTLGLGAVFLVGELVRRAGWGVVALAGIGGLIYVVGVVILVTRRPRLFPRVFSYHEVFHVLVIVANAFHFLMVLKYVTPVS